MAIPIGQPTGPHSVSLTNPGAMAGSAGGTGAAGGLGAGGPWGAIAYAAIQAAQEVKSAIKKVLTIVKDAIDKVGESFTTLKNIVIDTVGAFQPFAIVQFNRALLDLKATFGSIFLPILKEGTAIIRLFADAIYSLPAGIKDLIRNVVDLALRFTGLVAITTTIVGSVVGIAAALVALGAVVYGATVVLVAMLPAIVAITVALAPLVVIFGAIGTAIVAVIAGLVQLGKIFFNTAGGAKLLHNIMEGFGQIMRFIETAIAAAMSAIKPVIDILKGALSELGDALSELFDALKPLLAAGLGVIISIVAAGLTALAVALTVVAKVVKMFLDIINNSPVGMLLRGLGAAMPGTDQKSSFGLGWAQPKVESDMNAMYNRITEEILKNSRLTGEEKVEDPNEKVAKYMGEWSGDLAAALKKYLSGEGGVTGPFSASLWLGRQAASIFR